MTNHVHLQMETGDVGIGRIMRRITFFTPSNRNS